MNIAEFRDKVSAAADLLKALACESRLHILCQLLEGEKSVSELEALVGVNQATISRHLATLRRERLVKTRRDAQWVFYSLSSAEASSVLEALFDVYCAPRTASLPEARETRSNPA